MPFARERYIVGMARALYRSSRRRKMDERGGVCVCVCAEEVVRCERYLGK